MKNILLGATLLLSLATIACSAQREYDNNEIENLYDSSLYYGFNSSAEDFYTDILDAEMEGDIGDRTFEKEKSFISGFGEEEYASIEITTAKVLNGSGMVILEIVGGLNHESLVPGFVGEFQAASSYSARRSDTLQINTILCSGPMPREWDYDDIGSLVRVEVEEMNPELVPDGTTGRTIKFTTTSSAGDEAEGSLDIITEHY